MNSVKYSMSTSFSRKVLFVALLATALAPLAPLDRIGMSPRLVAQDPAAPAAQASGLVFVDSIAVEGNVRQTESAVVGASGLRAGTEVSFRDIQAAVRALWSTGLFSDIQVRALGNEGEPILLVFDVEEAALVRQLQIRGLQSISESAVRDEVGLQSGEPYSPVRVARAREFIRAELAKEGIPFASIEERQEPVSGAENEIQLILDVTEGQRVTIAQVEFVGNEHLSRSDLQEAMNTQPEGFWWFRSGGFDQESLEEDLDVTLPTLYSAHGFLDFAVVSDSLIIDPNTGKARLEVTVDEGPQYRLAEFRVEGNRRFPTGDLEQYYEPERGGLLQSLGLRRGAQVDENPVFDQTIFDDATANVHQLYRNSGYLFSQVVPFVERTEVEGEPAVEVGWRIEEGQPAYVNRIEIRGNEFTHERVIREQIYLVPGDVYSEARLLQSWQGVQSVGFFETPMDVPTMEVNEETGDVDITFHVQEKQTGSINFGTSVGGGTGVAGFVGYDQPNLFGQAKAGSLRWDFGRYQNNFSLSFTDPALFQSRVSGNISLFNSRDRFFQFSTGERRRVGASTRFGIPIPGYPRTRVFAGYSLSRTDYRQREGVDDTSLFGRPPGTQSTASVGITRQTLDHPIFPTSGSTQSINSEFSGGLLGGDGDFSKHTVEGTWWVPAGQLGGSGPGSRGIRLALGLSARAGTIFGDASNFPFERFWMGGVQFGETLRGYEETTLTPQGYVPRGSQEVSDIARLGNSFLLLTAEYAIRLSDQMSVSLFYDAGGVWRDPLEIDASRLFRGAGVGIQLVTPFGPLGLDYAYGFDKTDPGFELHFRMGGF